MTQDDIISMAREAGWRDEFVIPAGVSVVRLEMDDFLTLFAGLVAAAEREACAKVAKQVSDAMAQRYGDGAECITTGEEISDAIRARGAADPA